MTTKRAHPSRDVVAEPRRAEELSASPRSREATTARAGCLADPASPTWQNYCAGRLRDMGGRSPKPHASSF
jgi:hypothetical protein